MFAWMWHRAIDGLYAVSDASHEARGWEVRKGRFGARRYRLNVRAWLESQRRTERFGSAPAPVAAVRDETADLWDAMRWTSSDMSPILRDAIEQACADGIPSRVWSAPRCKSPLDGQEAA